VGNCLVRWITLGIDGSSRSDLGDALDLENLVDIHTVLSVVKY
jgi:hypothetical protein